MTEFAFLFRGLGGAGSAEQQQKTLEKWGAWMTELNQHGLMTNPGLPLHDTAKSVGALHDLDAMWDRALEAYGTLMDSDL